MEVLVVILIALIWFGISAIVLLAIVTIAPAVIDAFLERARAREDW
jgi:hypothetical protein